MKNNDRLKTALKLLFNNYWIIRDQQPDEYALLKSVEKEVYQLVKERFGFAIRFTPDYIKMEKIPVEAKSWMGFQEFQLPEDYALFCCLLAFLEERSRAPYFLLSHICEDLLRLYPVKDAINWQNFTHRKSLIRVLKKAASFHLIEERDGTTELFGQDESAEVLYYATGYERTFMRPYPEDIASFAEVEELAAIDQQIFQQENAQRYLAYRRLFLEPSVLRADIDEQLLYYFRNQRKAIADFITTYTDLTYEVYKDFFQLTADNGNQPFVFPGTKALDDILLQLGALVRQEAYVPETAGMIRLSHEEWSALIILLYENYHHGWSKEYRETKPVQVLAAELLVYGTQWELLRVVEDEVWLLPQLARFSGEYNEDFKKQEKINGE